jgi:hypothetical protein
MATWSASGTFLSDGTVRLVDYLGRAFDWDPSLEHAIDVACQAAGREITQAEWHAAFPELPYRRVCPD